MQIKQNIISGLLVSIIALPLSIAIASASQFPVMAGIFTAIIGGILVSQISGSHVTINGCAAGMIVVIIDAVEKLGKGDLILGYKYTLGAIVCASILQIMTSFTKIPQLTRKFPEIVIRGMMMSIGLIVLVKQIFILNGFKPINVDIIALIKYLPQSFIGMQIESFLIGLITISIIIIWKKYFESKKQFRFIPAHLLAIIIGSIIANIYNLHQHQHFLNPSVASPLASSYISIPNNITSAFSFPNFDLFFSIEFLIATLTIYAVASLETMVSAIAVEKVDPLKRTTDLKKEIRAIGLGNAICGMIGALPMIAEIVRSTANVSYGATNKFSNFFHGIALLLMITVFSNFLNYIPLCVLSGMLIIIGFNMINYQLFIKIFKNNKIHALIILITIFFTLKIDLLCGILFGLIAFFIGKKIFKIDEIV